MNGSRVDGGCKVNLTHSYCGTGIYSFLTDGVNPVINTTHPDWASELLTVRKTDISWTIPYDHVFLGFLFQPPVSLTSIRMSLLQCPQWGIEAPNITVYADMGENGNLLNFDHYNNNVSPLAQTQDNQSSCNDLVPVTIRLETDTQYKIWYIVVSFELHADIEWVHVGEVQFISIPLQPPPSTSIKPQPPPSMNSKPGIFIYD